MTRFIERNPVNFRGTNYTPSISYSPSKLLGWLPVTGMPTTISIVNGDRCFDPRHNDDELRALAALGINNIRLFGSFWAWAFDAPGFMEALGSIARNCEKYGISITYVLWSTTSHPLAGLNDSLWYRTIWNIYGTALRPGRINWQAQSTQWGRLGDNVGQLALYSSVRPDHWALLPTGEPWSHEEGDEPGNVLFSQPFQLWDPHLRGFIEGYLKAVGEFFSGVGERVFASYDLFNEPDVDDGTGVGVKNRMQFIYDTYRILRLNHGAPILPCTVGWGFMSNLAKQSTTVLKTLGVQQTYLSSHTYEENVITFRNHLRDARDFAMNNGLPYVCSEFWKRQTRSAANYPTAMAPRLDVVVDEFIGSQIWGFLAYNLFILVGNTGEGIDGFLTPRRGQFGPKGASYGEYFGNAVSTLYWPPNVTIDVTPPRPGDLEAVKRWTRSRSGPVRTW